MGLQQQWSKQASSGRKLKQRHYTLSANAKTTPRYHKDRRVGAIENRFSSSQGGLTRFGPSFVDGNWERIDVPRTTVMDVGAMGLDAFPPRRLEISRIDFGHVPRSATLDSLVHFSIVRNGRKTTRESSRTNPRNKTHKTISLQQRR
jgi:hypothetical protein